jgi:hypothetical protein
MKRRTRKWSKLDIESGWGLRRIPTVQVERAIFDQVKRFAETSASARIFLQHLLPRASKSPR